MATAPRRRRCASTAVRKTSAMLVTARISLQQQPDASAPPPWPASRDRLSDRMVRLRGCASRSPLRPRPASGAPGDDCTGMSPASAISSLPPFPAAIRTSASARDCRRRCGKFCARARKREYRSPALLPGTVTASPPSRSARRRHSAMRSRSASLRRWCAASRHRAPSMARAAAPPCAARSAPATAAAGAR